jgi:magnesium transporter
MATEQKTGEPLTEIVWQLTHRPKERMVLFRSLSIAGKGATFNILSPHVRQEILNQLSIDESVDLLDHLDLRRAHHILDRMGNTTRRRHIAKRLKNDLHAKVEHFLQFHPQTSAALIHLNYVFLLENKTIGETASIIEDYLHNTGKVPEVLVSRDGRLLGEVPLSTLVRERNSSKLGSHLRLIKTLLYTSSRENIISLFTKEPHKKVALLDTDGSVLGIIYSDDVLDILEKSPATSLYSFAGVEESERPFDSTGSKIRHRYKWLILNLGTAFLAAGMVSLFEDTLTQIVLLAIYMPIIAGMGGNAATQTLAIMVRGISIGEISLRNSKPALIREILSGLANGAITGTLIAIISILFGQDPLLGLVAGIAVLMSLVVAGVAGTLIPLVLRQLGKDPATSATIFITTATDVLGFLALLGLATLILV